MTLFDTIDGLFMAHAYQWAFLRPARKLFYNITVTALSVLVALSIGVIVLVQLLAEEFSVPALGWVASIDLQYVGFALVAVFVLGWAGSVEAFQLLERRRGSAGR